jgi:hypothetical protein
VAALATLAMLLTVSGCGASGSVTGRVTFEDGSPLDAGTISCETQVGDKVVMARADIKRDGTFELGVKRPGDGIPPGTYRVAVAPRALYQQELDNHAPPIIDSKFTKYDTSGLSLEVKPGANALTVTVTKPKKDDAKGKKDAAKGKKENS